MITAGYSDPWLFVPFEADHCGLDLLPRFHHGEDRYHSVLGKIDMLDRLADRVKCIAPREADVSKVGLKPSKIASAKPI